MPKIKENNNEKGEDYDYTKGLDYKIENVSRSTSYIENVVATVIVEILEKIDLNKIARKYVEVEYNPERFPGLVMRIEKPRATILIFSTGKMVMTGMRKAKEAPQIINQVVKNIKNAGIKVSNPVITIQNIVSSGDLHISIDLNNLCGNTT